MKKMFPVTAVQKHTKKVFRIASLLSAAVPHNLQTFPQLISTALDKFSRPIRWKELLCWPPIHSVSWQPAKVSGEEKKEKKKSLKIWKCFLVLEADEIRYHLIASFMSVALIPLLQQWCFIPLITHNTHADTHWHTHSIHTEYSQRKISFLLPRQKRKTA